VTARNLHEEGVQAFDQQDELRHNVIGDEVTFHVSAELVATNVEVETTTTSIVGLVTVAPADVHDLLPRHDLLVIRQGTRMAHDFKAGVRERAIALEVNAAGGFRHILATRALVIALIYLQLHAEHEFGSVIDEGAVDVRVGASEDGVRLVPVIVDDAGTLPDPVAAITQGVVVIVLVIVFEVAVILVDDATTILAGIVHIRAAFTDVGSVVVRHAEFIPRVPVFTVGTLEVVSAISAFEAVLANVDAPEPTFDLNCVVGVEKRTAVLAEFILAIAIGAQVMVAKLDDILDVLDDATTTIAGVNFASFAGLFVDDDVLFHVGNLLTYNVI
jgi:hypothetical protein